MNEISSLSTFFVPSMSCLSITELSVITFRVLFLFHFLFLRPFVCVCDVCLLGCDGCMSVICLCAHVCRNVYTRSTVCCLWRSEDLGTCLHLLPSERGFCVFCFVLFSRHCMSQGCWPSSFWRISCLYLPSYWRSTGLTHVCSHNWLSGGPGDLESGCQIGMARAPRLNHLPSHLEDCFYADGDTSPLKTREYYFMSLWGFSSFSINGDILIFGLVYLTIIYLINDFNFSWILIFLGVLIFLRKPVIHFPFQQMSEIYLSRDIYIKLF